MASDLQGNIEKLNNGIAFLIRHSQKLFKVNVLASWFEVELFFSRAVLPFLLLLIMCSQFALKESCMASGVAIPQGRGEGKHNLYVKEKTHKPLNIFIYTCMCLLYNSVRIISGFFMVKMRP